MQRTPSRRSLARAGLSVGLAIAAVSLLGADPAEAAGSRDGIPAAGPRTKHESVQHRSRLAFASATPAVDDPVAFGEFVADVERPSGQYRGRYSTRLSGASGLLK